MIAREDYARRDSDLPQKTQEKRKRDSATDTHFPPDLQVIIDNRFGLDGQTRQAILDLLDGPVDDLDNAWGTPGSDGHAEGE